MSINVDKLFEPTMWGWLRLAPEQLRGSGESKVDNEEFDRRFEQMVTVRNELLKIRKGVQNWSNAMKKLYSSAKYLGNAVETTDTAMKEALWTGDILLKDDSALQNIKEKIQMIDHLIAQKKKLSFMRLKGRHAERMLEQIRKKEQTPSYERKTQKYMTIKTESERQREEVMNQIMVVIEKCLSQAHANGVSDLVKPQLQAFKLSQYHMFLNCQKLVQGKQEDQGLHELEAHWNDFTARVANEIPNQQAGGSFDGGDEVKGKLLTQMENMSDGSDEFMDEAVKKKTEEIRKSKAEALDIEKKQYRDSDFDGEDLTDLDTTAGSEAGGDDDDDDEDDMSTVAGP